MEYGIQRTFATGVSRIPITTKAAANQRDIFRAGRQCSVCKHSTRFANVPTHQLVARVLERSKQGELEIVSGRKPGAAA